MSKARCWSLAHERQSHVNVRASSLGCDRWVWREKCENGCWSNDIFFVVHKIAITSSVSRYPSSYRLHVISQSCPSTVRPAHQPLSSSHHIPTSSPARRGTLKERPPIVPRDFVFPQARHLHRILHENRPLHFQLLQMRALAKMISDVVVVLPMERRATDVAVAPVAESFEGTRRLRSISHGSLPSLGELSVDFEQSSDLCVSFTGEVIPTISPAEVWDVADDTLLEFLFLLTLGWSSVQVWVKLPGRRWVALPCGMGDDVGWLCWPLTKHCRLACWSWSWSWSWSWTRSCS
jgi:hypothetical protein